MSFRELLTRVLMEANHLCLLLLMTEVIVSSNKAKLIAINFASNFTLDDQGHLPEFPPH